MKKTVKMTCILKSGVLVEDTCKIAKNNTRAWQELNEIRNALEESIGYKEPACSNITFGKLTVAVAEIAAIKFKEY